MTWKKTENQTKQIFKLAQDINHSLDDVCDKFKRLDELCRQAYKSAPRTDSHFLASPLGPSRLLFYLRAHMIQKGLRVSNTFVDPNKDKKTFQKQMQNALDWLMKFKEDEVANG